MENRKDYLLPYFMNTMQKRVVKGSMVLLLIIIVVVFLNMGGTVIIDRDTVINNNFTIAGNKEVILTNGAKLTVMGDMVIKGILSCSGGSLPLVVRDSLTVKGKIHCTLEKSAPVSNSVAITIAAKHIAFDAQAELSANGHVELTHDALKLLLSSDAIARMYKDAGENTGGAPRVGPLTEDGQEQTAGTDMQTQELPFQRAPLSDTSTLSDSAPSMLISGTWFVGDTKILPSGLTIPTPPKNVEDILILFDVGEEGAITFQDIHMTGPNGMDGTDDITKNCEATGKDGAHAFRMRVIARNVNLNNFQLELGNGGNGGNAETAKDCAHGSAKGGSGGEAGNFKITALGYIHSLKFIITPGKGGDGGNATAYARSGVSACPGENGGDAVAIGGTGRKNKKELAIAGKISGLDTIQIGRVVGGSGGSALATPGRGGDGTLCGCQGGKGGSGSALGGNGGDAWASAPIGTIEGHGGDGGSADTRGGAGGNGGSCSLLKNGGGGGAGGSTNVVAGVQGKGRTANGNTGIIKNQGGGTGGAGGDGCNPGVGGQGGIGAPLGAFGPLGKNTCVDKSAPTPPKDTGPTLINAILYKGMYLPVDQLIIENEAACGDEHWHAAQETVKATNDLMVTDPGPQCGFGKVKENRPEMVPKTVEHGALVELLHDSGL